jgi:hypothetical protein
MSGREINDGEGSSRGMNLANRHILKNIPVSVLPSLPVPIGRSWPYVIQIIDGCIAERANKKELLLPNFHESESISVFSDYGGEHRGALYRTYSFLFNEFGSRDLFLDQMQEIRHEFCLDSPFKEIAYKDLGYGPIHRSLEKYLTIANNTINGLLFTLIIDKKIASVIGQNAKSTPQGIKKILGDADLGNYKPEVAEKAVRIIHTVAYFCRLLSKMGHKVFWMTDNDAIIPEYGVNQFRKLFGNILDLYGSKGYFGRPIGYAKPFSEENRGDKPFEDFLSIPDLVAGSLEHYFTRADQSGELPIKQEVYEQDVDKQDVYKILKWFCVPEVALKKLTLIVRQNERGELKPGIVDFELKEHSYNANYIDIEL